jgi:molybdenum cofactor cytidylyltransferase
VRLREALRVQRGDVIAFVGAGGKTSALFRLADELRAEGWRVVATTTTRVAIHEAQRAPVTIQVTSDTALITIRQALDQHGFVFVYRSDDLGRHKVIGLAPNVVSGLVDAVNSDVLLVEADGARRLPFKAPYDHEPVIPLGASLVVPVAGVDALGQPLDDEHVYNAGRILARYGFPEGGPLIPPWMAVTIRDPQLGLRGVPCSARVIPLLNKVAANGYDRARARRVAQLVLRSSRVDAVALGAMQSPDDPVHEVQQRVAAVILAAGTSTRMGQSKLLLPWDDRTVVETVVARLIAARVAEIIVVTGHQADQVTRLLADLPVRTVHNPAYVHGEMLSSLQVGLLALPATTAACLVVMGDQPMIEGRVIGRLLAAYAEGRGDIVLPVHRGQRGHPVLIGQRFWPDLLALQGGAPRDVIKRYPEQVVEVQVSTDSVLRDIDTPEQYRYERFLAGLP